MRQFCPGAMAGDGSGLSQGGPPLRAGYAGDFPQEAEGYFDRNLEQLREAGFDGILIRSLEEADYLKQQAVRLPVYGDFQLYAWNREAAAALRQLGLARLTFPLELNERELNDLGSSGWELPVYGYMPAMVSAQCVQKTYAGCTRRPGWTRLKDRTGKELPVRSRCAFCFNTIYNPLPLSLFGLAKEVRRLTPSPCGCSLPGRRKRRPERCFRPVRRNSGTAGRRRLRQGSLQEVISGAEPSRGMVDEPVY